MQDITRKYKKMVYFFLFLNVLKGYQMVRLEQFKTFGSRQMYSSLNSQGINYPKYFFFTKIAPKTDDTFVTDLGDP